MVITLLLKNMRIGRILFICMVAIFCASFSGCALNNDEKKAYLLTTDYFIDIKLSAPEGSSAVRVFTIDFMFNGEKKSDTIDLVTWVDNANYDDDKREQIIEVSDYNQDGIFDLIAYREFWFPDLNMVHSIVPLWPTVYEYDIKKGFVIASSNFQKYYEEFAKSIDEQISSGKEHMDDVEILALKRIEFAAEKVADGSFVPASSYNGKYYDDVYELVKGIT